MNLDILDQEIKGDPGVSTEPASVTFSGTNIVVLFGSLITSAEQAALDAVIAAHQGSAFSEPPLSTFAEAEVSDDSGTEQVLASIPSGPLRAGTYLISWYLEVAATTTSSSSGSQGRFKLDGTERGTTTNGNSQWTSMGGSVPLTVVDGQALDLQLSYERVGNAGNAARARRARLTIAQL